MQHYVRQLSDQAGRVTVIALHYPYSDRAYTWEGVRVYPLNGANSRWKRSFTLRRKLNRVFNELHRKYPVDVIHSMWLNESAWFGYLLSKKTGIPFVATAHGQDVLPEENRYLKQLLKAGIPIHCLSDFQRDLLVKFGFRDVRVIEWGIADMPVSTTRDIDLITVGNLIFLKNPGYFLELCCRIREEHPELKAVLVGDGPLRRPLGELVSTLDMENTVSFEGMCPHTETLELIARSKVLVHPARFEGFGLVITEALAAGTHVLSAPVGLAASDSAVHHLSMDLEKDAAQILDLLHREAPSPKKYTIENTVDRYLTVYEGR